MTSKRKILKAINHLEELIELAKEDIERMEADADISHLPFPVFMTLMNMGAIEAWRIEIAILKDLVKKGGD